jgi:sec-independent protein translocase protein TatC
MNSEDQPMPLLAHLMELRQRLLYAVITLLAVFLVLMFFSQQLYTLFLTPLLNALPEQQSLLASGTLAPFMTPFKLTFYLSLFLSMPLILYQVWAFISPGLFQNEKRYALPLLIASVVLFYIGVLFAYVFVVPVIFGFMAQLKIPGVTYMPDISSSLDLILNLFLGFGIAFEIPVATLLCILAGITTPAALAAKRPFIIVACFVFGAILTPPDILSQTMMALPMILLFELAIFIGRFLGKKEKIEKMGSE